MKRIIVCADGTWNTRDQVDEESGRRRPTNVTKVARAIRPRDDHGVDQVVFYHDGIGTRGTTDKFSGGAFGRGIEDNIRNMYRFLVYNYEPSDELYMFGFSRGAFTIRSLTGFMNLVGLVEKDDDYRVPDIYLCYEKGKRKGSPEWRKAFQRMKHPRPCPAIRFVGVWDTVGALGAPGLIGKLATAFNGNKYQYHDVDLHPTIEHAYHALAIDEQRKPFAPTLWVRPSGWGGTLEQTWFPGVHGNVGGGCAPDGLANEALHWMVGKAEALGLEFDHEFLEPFRPCFNSVLHDSMSVKYRVFGPHVRPIGKHRADGELVHQAAIDRRNHLDDYRPKNLEDYLNNGGAGLAYAQTTRISRGTPC
jgi:uncharacterized protein (DUF2235 family)